MDNNGILRFLTMVFVLGYAIQFGSLGSGLLTLDGMNMPHWLLLAVIIFIPAVAAVIALLTTPEHERESVPAIPQVWPLPVGPAVFIALLIPAMFGIIYATTYLLGYQKADWGMYEAVAMLRAMSPQPLPEGSVSAIGYLMLSVGLPLSILLGATLFALVALGAEYGWRGYLLTRLMPLGRVKAALMVGLLSYLWILPLLFVGYGGLSSGTFLWYSLLKMLIFFLLVSLILGELLRQKVNVGLCALFTGAIIAQHVSGIWIYLFPMGYFPYTGPFGVIGLLCWALLAVTALLLGRTAGENAPND